MDDRRRARIKGSVVLVLEDVETGEKTVHDTENLITTAGEEYYAQQPGLANATDFVDGSGDFNGNITVATAGNAPAAGSDYSDLTSVPSGGDQLMDTGYPQVSDPDSDNTGSGPDTLTYRASYSTSQGNGTIDRIAVTDAAATGTSPLVSYATITPVVKGNTQTMKVFANHTFADDGV